MDDKYELRQVTDSDASFMVELHNDPIVLRNLTHPQPITLAHHMSWWKRTAKDRRQERFIFTINNAPAGVAKFYDIDHVNQNCILGADIHASFRGQGHAVHLWTLMLQRCFAVDQLNLYRASLTAAEYNSIAIHLYEKLGFEREGRLSSSLYRDERFYDQILMFMLKPWWVNRP